MQHLQKIRGVVRTTPPLLSYGPIFFRGVGHLCWTAANRNYIIHLSLRGVPWFPESFSYCCPYFFWQLRSLRNNKTLPNQNRGSSSLASTVWSWTLSGRCC